MKNLFLLIILSLALFANTIKSSSSATKDTKREACEVALKQAQKEALETSGINIFSSFSVNKTMKKKKIEKIVSSTLQSSYGLVKTKDKKESTSFDETTGQITCKIDGEFEVDTGNLKNQMKALMVKYDNIHKEEEQKKEALINKKNQLKKYKKLVKKIKKNHTFIYNDKYSCGDKLGISDCEKELKKEIKIFFKKKLANKYSINSSFLTISEITYVSKIKITTKNGLTASYNGEIKAKVIKVKNPYSDNENISTIKQLTNEIPNSVSNKKEDSLIKSYTYLYLSYEFDKLSKTTSLNLKAPFFFSDNLYYKLGGGYGHYKINDYIFPYSTASLGLSYYLFKYISLDVDYVVPIVESTIGKAFIESSINLYMKSNNLFSSIGLKSSTKGDVSDLIVLINIGVRF